MGDKRRTLFCKCGHCKSIHRLYFQGKSACNMQGCKCKNYRPVEQEKAVSPAAVAPSTQAASTPDNN